MPLQELTRELAEEIAHEYPTLQRLTLARNALREVPHLVLLPPLRRLDLSENALRALPSSAETWGAQLEFLDLTGNALESLQQLRACQSLVTLRVGGNRIQLVSELKYLQPLENLRELVLEGNPIADHPVYRREVMTMLHGLHSLDGRIVTPAERLYARMQQKPPTVESKLAEPSVASTSTPAERTNRCENPPRSLSPSATSSVSPPPPPTSTPTPMRSLPELDLSDIDPRSVHASPSPLPSLRSLSSSSSSHAPQSSPSSPLPSPRLLTPASVHRVALRSHERNGPSSVSITRGDDYQHGRYSQRYPSTTAKSPVEHSHVSTRGVLPPYRDASTSTTLTTMASRACQGVSDTHHPVAKESQATIQLLESRVSALESILRIQDKSLEQGLVRVARTSGSDGTAAVAAGHAAGTPEASAQLYMRLLTAWRQKVMSLMVELKTRDLLGPHGGAPLKHRLEAHERGSNGSSDEALQQMNELREQVELWRQRAADATAQRDLERVRVQETQHERVAAETKVVRVVRTLAAERARLQQIAEDVACFSARGAVLTSHMDAMVLASTRLHAFERRLQFLADRVQLASRLIAHREARLRNSEAAIVAERRVWQHKLATAAEQAHPDGKTLLRRSTGRHGSRSRGVRSMLRPATELACRAVFHRLDPYDTGLVRAAELVDALTRDIGVRDAMGDDATAQEKMVTRLTHGLCMRGNSRNHKWRAPTTSLHPSSDLKGNVTWGELMLLFIPGGEEDSHGDICDETTQCEKGDDIISRHRNTEGQRDGSRNQDFDQVLFIPPVFEHRYTITEPTESSSTHVLDRKRHRREKKSLSALSRDDLITQVLALRHDRAQLEQRVLQDATSLQQRASSIQREWAEKVEQLVASNNELQRQVVTRSAELENREKQLQLAERDASETQHALQSARRQICEQQAEFQKKKEEMEAQRLDCVEREQAIWQRELQDASFAQSQLQTENAKLDVTIRQLERELAKRKEQLLTQESVQITHLEAKVHKRDEEIAKLRRERNTILNSLREQERIHAVKAAVPEIESVATQTEQTSVSSDPLERPQQRSIAIQVEKLDDTSRPQQAQPLGIDRGKAMRLDDIAEHTIVPRTTGIRPKNPSELHQRLQHLESLSASLLAD